MNQLCKSQSIIFLLFRVHDSCLLSNSKPGGCGETTGDAEPCCSVHLSGLLSSFSGNSKASGVQAVVSSYEARQKELMQENRGLEAALSDLQSDYRLLANKQAATQQLRAAAVGKLVEEEDLTSRLQDADVVEVQAELSSKMAAMKSKLEAIYDGPLQQV